MPGIPVRIQHEVDVVQQEIRVLEIAQKTQVYRYSEDQDDMLATLRTPGQNPTHAVIEADRKQQQDKVFRIPVAVENQGGKNQESKRGLEGKILRTHKIAEHTDRHEQKNELIRVKQHESARHRRCR